jgi:hypothetical protein
MIPFHDVTPFRRSARPSARFLRSLRKPCSSRSLYRPAEGTRQAKFFAAVLAGDAYIAFLAMCAPRVQGKGLQAGSRHAVHGEDGCILQVIEPKA